MVVSTQLPPSSHPLAAVIERLETGGCLIPESPDTLVDVVDILESYGYVIGAYSVNLTYIAQSQFLVLFPFFKYFNGEVTVDKLLKHWWHDRVNYEFSEYCMKAMFWHGCGGKIDAYLNTPEFEALAKVAVAAKIKGNPLMQAVHRLFPNFLPEQVRVMCYYSTLGQFWDVMSEMFLRLAKEHAKGNIRKVQDVVNHVKAGLVAAAANPITYTVEINGQSYDLIPKSLEATFLMDAAVPYVEAVFFRSFPFMGTVSYNAQAQQIPFDQGFFSYGALFADPLPVGAAGIPPTLLMMDMDRFLPSRLRQKYQRVSQRRDTDLHVRICETFQQSMFCVTSAAILGLAPHALDSTDLAQLKANREYFEGWLSKLQNTRITQLQ
jgi:CO2 hydration protein